MRDYATGALATLAGLGLLALVLWLSEPRQTLEMLARLAPWQAAVLIATSFGVSLFTALAWHAILRRYGHRVSVWYLFELTIVAFAAGWAIPSGFVAGIPLAAWFLRRRRVPFSKGMASFGISRFLELTAYAGILPVALLSAVGSRGTVRAGAAAMLGAMLLAYLDLFLDWRLARRLLHRVGRVSSRLRHPVQAAVAFCADVAYFFDGPIGYVLLAAAFSFAAIGMALARALLASAFLDLGLSTPEVVVMFAITVLLMAVPFLPGAIGAFEGGIAAAFEMIGRSKADGMAYALSVHAAELVVVAAGFALFGHLGVGHLLSRNRDPVSAAAARHAAGRA